MYNFAVLSWQGINTAVNATITAQSDVPCQLQLAWSLLTAGKHQRVITTGKYQGRTMPFYDFTTQSYYPQLEPGDSLTHTFITQLPPPGEIFYFNFTGNISGQPSPSSTATFNYNPT